jgi:hypothetical protein
MADKVEVNLVMGEMTTSKLDLDVKSSKFPAIMAKAIEGILSKPFAIKKSATGLKAGFVVSANLMTLKEDTHKGLPMVFCAISISLDELPKKFLVAGKIEGSAKVDITKDLQGDAEFAVETAAKEAAKTAIKQIEKAASK